MIAPIGPALELATMRRDDEGPPVRVVFELRPDQLQALKDEAGRQAAFRARYDLRARAARANITQVIRDALVAAGVIPP